jgi:enamine deaminase RidA (YjgF/YER057c/UK114 family)
VEQTLESLGLELPSVRKPAGNYMLYVQSGNLVFMAGATSIRPDGIRVAGKLGADLTVEQGYEAARFAMLNVLARLKEAVGDLDRVTQVVRVFGMVNSDPSFTQTTAVMNGASDLLVDLFGDRGRHARCAVGMATLPQNAAVEIESIFQV